ncbi:uncharacterized PE-PGRS family protein PE_PGRS46-like [Lytechinus variegatus]|uniref:uncharacterized PE-PGRS family protein PE_PGRS46-like n=1 Tax=Lytechinus variegatus TaxID=7654 RepID=UPI001BB19805|nr:uncharacterized PE-PGRS family protein PE_PGRS46-like [Lytechinus variegatus]
MMDNPVETGILSGDPFSHQYEVNSNEKVYSEGTTGKVETGGEMEKTSGDTRDADGGGGGIVEEDGFGGIVVKEGKGGTDAGNGLGDGEGHIGDGHGDDDVVMADVDAEDGYVGGAGEGAVGDVPEECIGNGGLDQAQPAVLENEKQNGRRSGELFCFLFIQVGIFPFE